MQPDPPDRTGFPWSSYRSVPKHLNITREVLEQQIARGMGERTALVSQSGVFSYRELFDRVNALALGLREMGIDTGDRVLIRMPNSLEFAVSFFALAKLGALPVLVNSLLGPSELRAVLEQARPELVITEASRAGAVRELSDRVAKVVCAGGAERGEIDYEALARPTEERLGTVHTRSEEPAFIVFTSGTTGKPKGIIHAHRWIVASGDLNRFRLPPQEGDVVMATGEWSFISALGHNLLFPLRHGVSGAVLEGRITPENVLEAISRHRVTVLYSVATVYRRILAVSGLEQRFALGSLRCGNSTGEALREATYQEWKERFGCELYEHYGVSEYQLVVGQGPRHPVKPGSVGVPAPGVGLAIVDDTGSEVPPGAVGRAAISAKDPALFLGYHNDAARTEAAFQKGLYYTGDLAYRDSEGYFFIAGRADDCFKSRGLLVAPTEVENALQRHPAVAEAVVVPEPDAEVGNKVLGIVVLAPGYEGSFELGRTLCESVRQQLAHYKAPHRIEFVDALPKSPVEKILRSELTRERQRC